MRFSIIIPVYNVGMYLRECLDSLQNQSFPDWEVVCVDDGSPDDCGRILDEYALRDSRFVVKHIDNIGVSGARNLALKIAHGEYITFLDGDDVVADDWLANYDKVIAETGADLVRIRISEFSDGQRLPDYCPERRFDVYESLSFPNDFLDDFARHGYACAVAYKSAMVKGVEFPLGVRVSEDTLFNFKVLPLTSNVVQCEYSGYFYRQRMGSGRSQTISIDEMALYLRACEKVLECCEESAALRRCVSKICWDNIFWWLAKSPRGRPQEVRKVLKSMYDAGRLVSSDYSLRVRIAFWGFILTGLRWPLWCHHRIGNVIHCIRGLL